MTATAVTTESVLTFVRAYAEVVAQHRQELTKLDAAIGDADHGENLNRGFVAAVAALPDAATATPSSVLKAVAMALISKVGGASGPLYGTAFLRASTALDGKTELTASDVVDALDAGLGGIKQRGKAEVGDKTMVDAWAPAVEAARGAVESGADLSAVLRAAAEAAVKGRDAVTAIVARKGRASYLGERSAGHQDPGATSTALLFQTLATCSP
jgi:dihydroxyacetone kinase-like protein